jgi:hypothetical protein
MHGIRYEIKDSPCYAFPSMNITAYCRENCWMVKVMDVSFSTLSLSILKVYIYAELRKK